jgi:hypothetical protein
MKSRSLSSRERERVCVCVKEKEGPETQKRSQKEYLTLTTQGGNTRKSDEQSFSSSQKELLTIATATREHEGRTTSTCLLALYTQ